MCENYKIIISYDGTDYKGWQRQPKKKTIQGCIEKALFRITKKEISVIGAGRTDAGVHARAQVANFKAQVNLPEEDLSRAMNALLPEDIRIISLKKAPSEFHARKWAVSKVYRYRIFSGRNISPFQVRYALHWPFPLDPEKMKIAASHFVREADFTPFSSNRLLHPVRKILHSEIRTIGKEIVYTVEANGFLKYMVRTMVGTLLEIGKGRQTPDIIDTLFRGNRRALASPTAPARGLCLIKVRY